MRQIKTRIEDWPVAGEFRIAHGRLSSIPVVTLDITQDGITGRSECRPYARYGETPESVAMQIQSLSPDLTQGLSIEALQTRLPAGAARNAIDCALWDLKAQIENTTVANLCGLTVPKSVRTAFTLSIDTPRAMARAARNAARYSLLKLKIDGDAGLDCALAVMAARPDAELIIDANEALTPSEAKIFQQKLAAYPVVMIEQPVADKHIGDVHFDPTALPIICADESAHTSADLGRLWELGYRAVNVKLDKAGGLSEALLMIRAARAMGFVIMAGCMVGTSRALAPMMTLAGLADICDLDGPALLAKDRTDSLRYSEDRVYSIHSGSWS